MIVLLIFLKAFFLKVCTEKYFYFHFLQSDCGHLCLHNVAINFPTLALLMEFTCWEYSCSPFLTVIFCSQTALHLTKPSTVYNFDSEYCMLFRCMTEYVGDTIGQISTCCLMLLSLIAIRKVS